MTTRQRFAARGAAASAVATLVAAISHTAGGGAAPAALLVVAMAAILVFPAALLMGRSPGPVRIAVTTLVAQAAFHGAFDALGGPVAGGAIAGHHHGAVAIASGAGHAVGGEDPAMLVAHVVAAGVTFGILAYGDRAIARGAAWIRTAALALLANPSAPCAPRLVAASAPRRAHAIRARRVLRVRGPPAFSF